MRISDWSSDACSSDLDAGIFLQQAAQRMLVERADDRVRQSHQRFRRPAVDRAGRSDEIARKIDAQDLPAAVGQDDEARSEEHTSELQSLMRISYAVFCLKKKHDTQIKHKVTHNWKAQKQE